MFRFLTNKKQERIGRAIGVCHVIAHQYIQDEQVRNDLQEALVIAVLDIGGVKNNTVKKSSI